MQKYVLCALFNAIIYLTLCKTIKLRLSDILKNPQTQHTYSSWSPSAASARVINHGSHFGFKSNISQITARSKTRTSSITQLLLDSIRRISFKESICSVLHIRICNFYFPFVSSKPSPLCELWLVGRLTAPCIDSETSCCVIVRRDVTACNMSVIPYLSVNVHRRLALCHRSMLSFGFICKIPQEVLLAACYNTVCAPLAELSPDPNLHERWTWACTMSDTELCDSNTFTLTAVGRPCSFKAAKFIRRMYYNLRNQKTRMLETGEWHGRSLWDESGE